MIEKGSSNFILANQSKQFTFCGRWDDPKDTVRYFSGSFWVTSRTKYIFYVWDQKDPTPLIKKQKNAVRTYGRSTLTTVDHVPFESVFGSFEFWRRTSWVGHKYFYWKCFPTTMTVCSMVAANVVFSPHKLEIIFNYLFVLSSSRRERWKHLMYYKVATTY